MTEETLLKGIQEDLTTFLRVHKEQTVTFMSLRTDKEPRNTVDNFVALIHQKYPRRYGTPWIATFTLEEGGKKHLHVLMVKPFIPYKELQEMWLQVSGFNHCYCETVRGKKSDKNHVRNLTRYMSFRQLEKHGEVPAMIHSPGWKVPLRVKNNRHEQQRLKV